MRALPIFLFLSLTIALTMGCAGMQIEIPRKTVQEKVEKKFPIEKNAIIARTKLTEPEVYFAGEEVGIRLAFEGAVLGKKAHGTADVRGTLVYKSKKKKFYVEDLRLIELKVGDKVISNAVTIRAVVDKLIIKKLDGMVVYTLNEDKRKERFASAYMEKVEVDEKGDCLVITLGHRQ